MNTKVLIVDDEQETVESLEEVLRIAEYNVVTALSGQEAKDKILQDKPDVVLLDLMMPGINGWDVLKWLRQEVKLNTPTIIISAKNDLEDIQRGYALEADHYLIKPVHVEDIIQGIRTLCSYKKNLNTER